MITSYLGDGDQSHMIIGRYKMAQAGEALSGGGTQVFVPPMDAGLPAPKLGIPPMLWLVGIGAVAVLVFAGRRRNPSARQEARSWSKHVFGREARDGRSWRQGQRQGKSGLTGQLAMWRHRNKRRRASKRR